MPKQVPIPEGTILLMETLGKSPTTSVDIARWTRRDPVLSQVYKFILNGWPGSWAKELESYARRQYELSVHQGCVLWGARVVVPPEPYIERVATTRITGAILFPCALRKKSV